MFRVSASVASLIAREFHVGEADTVSFHRCRPRCFSARAVWFCQLPGELYTWLPLVAMSGHVANWCIRRLGACPYRTLQHVPCIVVACVVSQFGSVSAWLLYTCMFRVSASVASLIAREFHVGEADTVSFHRCRLRCFSARAVWFCQLPGELYTWLPLVAMSGHVANWCIRRLGACPYRTLQHVPCLSQCCFVDCSGISRR